jgi:hypothetical protein
MYTLIEIVLTRILILLLFTLRLSAQTDKDSFLVEGKDFKGYIMPDSRIKFFNEKPDSKFRPSSQDAMEAEEILVGYLKKMCENPEPYEFDDCEVIRTELHSYFRQYTGYMDSVTGHIIMYILMVSKEMQQSLDTMKKEWMDGVNDGGPILFHVYFDVDTKKVIDFSDNGEA